MTTEPGQPQQVSFPVSGSFLRAVIRWLLVIVFVVCLATLAYLWWRLAQDGLQGIFGHHDPGSAARNGNPPPPDMTPRQRVAVDVTFLLLAFLTVVCGTAWNAALPAWMKMRRTREMPAANAGGRSAIRSAGTFAAGVVVYLAVIVVAFRLNDDFNMVTGTQSTVTASRLVPGLGGQFRADILDGITAGLWEELLLFALPIALLTRGRRRSLPFQPMVWAVIFLLRLGIHLYYGWGSLFVLPWMIGACLLYKHLGTIWPMVAAHAVYDVVASLGNRAPHSAEALHTALDLVVIIAVAVILLASWRSRRRGPAPDTPSAL